jgi:3-phosphoshikimate 1-carboxyvinyltransferase
MQVIIHPSAIRGTLNAPASKSSMQRACAAALLRKGQTLIRNPGHSNDDQATLRVISDLGAEILEEKDSLLINSDGVNPHGNTVNCGESGLGMRMFAPIAALSEKRIVIDGEGSLLSRPMDFFDEVFPKLGVEIQSNAGRLPLTIKGPLQPQNIEIDGSLSSQFLTGLLIAYAAAGAQDITIRVTHLTSKPYIDLTLQVIGHFGWQVENRDYEAFYFPWSNGRDPDRQLLKEGRIAYTVEGDWSSGSFLLVAGAIAGQVSVKGLDISSTQADRAILQALKDSGALLSIQGEQILVGQGDLKAFRFNAKDCPDLFPPLVALAAYCKGTTVIEGIHRLAHKESNRSQTLEEEFGKMGIRIRMEEDCMLIDGGTGVLGASVHSRHDHRIAMACAVAALGAKGETLIEEAQAVNKSYPGFYADLKLLQPIAERKY